MPPKKKPTASNTTRARSTRARRPPQRDAPPPGPNQAGPQTRPLSEASSELSSLTATPMHERDDVAQAAMEDIDDLRSTVDSETFAR